MKRRAIYILAFLLLIIASYDVSAKTKFADCKVRGTQTIKLGAISFKVPFIFPNATLTVYKTGTTDLATIYSTNGGVVKSNPFTLDSNGCYEFWVDNGIYDLKFSGTGVPATFTDVYKKAYDDSQYLIDATNYGVNQDLSDDDTIELQAAIDATGENGVLLIPVDVVISNSININNHAGFRMVASLAESADPYGTAIRNIYWNGAANKAMFNVINSNSNLYDGFRLYYFKAPSVNVAAWGFFTTADYHINLSGVSGTNGSDIITFNNTGVGLQNNLPNGDALYRTRTITATGLGTAGGTLTSTIVNVISNTQVQIAHSVITTNSGQTGQIVSPYPQRSSSSHKFQNMAFNWSGATYEVAYRGMIINDLYFGANHERMQFKNIQGYGSCDPTTAQTTSICGVGISNGGQFVSGDPDAVSPFLGYTGGSNILQCNLEDLFTGGISFPIHGFSGTIKRIQGTGANVILFGSFKSTVEEPRYEVYRQVFNGGGEIEIIGPGITGGVNNAPQYKCTGTSKLTVRGGINHAGGVYDALTIPSFVADGETCDGEFYNAAVLDAVPILNARPIGFRKYHLDYFNIIEDVYGKNRETRLMADVPFADLGSIATTYGGLLSGVSGSTTIYINCTNCSATDPCTSGGLGQKAIFIQTPNNPTGRWKCN